MQVRKNQAPSLARESMRVALELDWVKGDSSLPELA